MTGIDLWHISLNGGADTEGDAEGAALGLLDAAERRRFRQIGEPELATGFAIRRAARRAILARYLDIRPRDVVFDEASDGKPVLRGAPAQLCFSASHSGDRAVVAVSGAGPVGADIEQRRRIDTARLAGRILSPSERLHFTGLEAGDRNAFIFRAWTAKEAVVKGIGCGLDLRDLPLICSDPALDPNGWKLVTLNGRLQEFGQWYACHPVPGAQTFVGVAAPGAVPVRQHDACEILAEYGIGVVAAGPTAPPGG